MGILELFRLIATVGPSGLSTIRKVHRDMVFYARGFMTTYAMVTLLRTGIIDDIEAEEGIEPDIYAKRKNLEPNVLQSLCDYLYSTRILDRRGTKLILSKKGKRLSQASVGLFDLLYAYSPVFHSLDRLLTKEQNYGDHVVRHANYVAKGSTEITRYLPFPAARKLLRKHGYRSVLDLGCGDGAFLFYISRDGFSGVGIDLAEQAIATARKRGLESGKGELLQFEVGDIFELQKIRKRISTHIEVVSLMFVLHEFLYGGEERVHFILESIRRTFPDAMLLICELCERLPDQLRRHPTAICEHHLYHRLSHQGYASTEEWMRIFTESNYVIEDQVLFSFAEQGYFLLRSHTRPN